MTLWKQLEVMLTIRKPARRRLLGKRVVRAHEGKVGR